MNRQILKLAIPNVISNITIPFVGIIEIALMGRLGSSAYIGGVGFGAMLFTLIFTGLAFLRMGTTGMTAQAYGASNFKETSYVLSRSVILAIFLGFGLILLQMPIKFLFISSLNGSEEALAVAAQYFYVRIWAAPATLSIFAFTGWFIGMQNSKIPMIVTIIVSISNIILSSIFVFYLDMAVVGVALGTVIAQYIGLSVCVISYQIRYKKNSAFLNWEKTFELKSIKRFFTVNRDIFIRSLLLTGSFFYFNALSASFGDDTLALNSIMLQFLWFFAFVIDGFSYAGGALVGKFIGAGDKKSINLLIKRCLLFGFFVSFGFTIIYVFSGIPIFKLLTDKLSVVELANKFIYWVWLFPLLSFMAFLLDGIYIGATATKTMRNVMLVVVLGIFLPLLYIFKYYFDNQGMWLALCIMLLARGVGLWMFSKKAIGISSK